VLLDLRSNINFVVLAPTEQVSLDKARSLQQPLKMAGELVGSLDVASHFSGTFKAKLIAFSAHIKGKSPDMLL